MPTEARVRVQLDLSVGEASALHDLQQRCALRSRADAVRTALAVLEWVRLESGRGRSVLAVSGDSVSCLVVPGVTTAVS